MKYVITEEQYVQLSEMIKLDIKVGDTLLGGKFKNKKVLVKTIGKNEKGDITINGKPLLRFRILKENDNVYLRRRITDIMKYVRSTTIYRSPCRADNITIYSILLKKVFFESVPFHFYVAMGMISGKDLIWDMIMSLYGDEIIDNYNQKCGVK
jgi:hypothetical protein